MNNQDNLTEADILQSLKGVIDPELMINIIDLGLVYEAHIDVDTKIISVIMTLTSPGCPMGDMIQEDARQLLLANYPDYSVEINLVWTPAWTLDRLTEKGKELLGRK